ncbi:hypothetical protein G6F57_019268 [Rhizopus arrhizus]|nr:hypothetical protein G6F57_019268 [Rhizopus arrhizus]
MALAGAQVVDRLHQAGAVGPEGPRPPGGSAHIDRGRRLRCGRSSVTRPPPLARPRCSRPPCCAAGPRGSSIAARLRPACAVRRPSPQALPRPAAAPPGPAAQARRHRHGRATGAGLPRCRFGSNTPT